LISIPCTVKLSFRAVELSIVSAQRDRAGDCCGAQSDEIDQKAVAANL